jgi:hypothetical protein
VTWVNGLVNGSGVTDSDLKTRLHQALGSRVVEARPLAVGFGLTGLAITLTDGRRLAVKAGEAKRRSERARARGVHARLSELPVPRVHHAARDLLVMDFIENDAGGTARAWSATPAS